MIVDFLLCVHLEPQVNIPEPFAEHAEKETEEVYSSFLLNYSHDRLSDFFPSQIEDISPGTEEAEVTLSFLSGNTAIDCFYYLSFC